MHKFNTVSKNKGENAPSDKDGKKTKKTKFPHILSPSFVAKQLKMMKKEDEETARALELAKKRQEEGSMGWQDHVEVSEIERERIEAERMHREGEEEGVEQTRSEKWGHEDAEAQTLNEEELE
ncbi:hypothetical protein NHQ30_005859 [Ciborinia camelliae]|nr:hypothetical protein NHQ30_005859 [Ciborinia camelliae]